MIRRFRPVLIIVALAVIAIVGGPWVYINFIREPAAESFIEEISSQTTVQTSDSSAQDSTTASFDPQGEWRVAQGSQVGYRVNEVLFGQRVTAVGRTGAITGSIGIDSLRVVNAEFSADLTTVRSDEPKRDAQFASRIMDTLNFPTATFSLTSPIDLVDANLTGTTTHQATGELTLRGTSKPVDLTIMSSVADGRISLVGEVTIIFSDWNIPNPSLPGITTEDRGILEFNLILER